MDEQDDLAVQMIGRLVVNRLRSIEPESLDGDNLLAIVRSLVIEAEQNDIDLAERLNIRGLRPPTIESMRSDPGEIHEVPSRFCGCDE